MIDRSPPPTLTGPTFDADPFAVNHVLLGGAAYPLVWRTDTAAPGYFLVHFTSPPDSQTLRCQMYALAQGISGAAQADGRPRFVIERAGRFDQQVTTKFHRDGAPQASLLVLGYEPTTVASRFSVADAALAAAAAGIGLNHFLAEFNPMFQAGEARLRPFVTELTWRHDCGAIVVLNNSLFPDDAAAGVPVGVLHKGEIVAPDPTARRVINSLGLMEDGEPSRPPLSRERCRHFLDRNDLD